MKKYSEWRNLTLAFTLSMGVVHLINIYNENAQGAMLFAVLMWPGLFSYLVVVFLERRYKKNNLEEEK